MAMNPDELEGLRERIGPVWDQLKHGLWHCTSVDRMAGVLEAGAIRPDGGKAGPHYRGGYCRQIGAVSLFDFDSAREADALRRYSNWAPFLRGHGAPISVWINLDREELRAGFIPIADLWARYTASLGTREPANISPYVEAGHLGPIPVSAFRFLLTVCRTDREPVSVDVNGETMDQLRAIEDEWLRQYGESGGSPVIQALLDGRNRARQRGRE